MKNPEIFISYKHFDSYGEMTEDYSIAKELYSVLKQRGFEVFFSDETLFLLGRSDYKKAIDRALDSAKLLVVIGTKQEHLLSGWVEYEYETFYEDILSGRKNDANIISYTKNVSQHELPRTLSRLQNYSVDSMSFEKLADYISNAMQESERLQSKEYGNEGHKPVNSTRVHTSERRGSVYESDYRNELSRLSIQANNSELTDKMALSYVYENEAFASEEGLCVLDVGSAYGFVAANRFGNDPRVDKVLCIDKNRRVIERAQILFADNEKMVFEVLDVESDSFVDDIRSVMDNYGIEKIHIVFSALTLHHLKNPQLLLRRLRGLMENGSYIILRGSDDGSKLCHPGHELMEKIINMTVGVTGVSDRFNGRKIYSQLSNSGFKDVRIFSTMKDLSEFDYDDRSNLFQESFAYRVNYFHRIVEANPDDEKAKKELKQMQEYLEEFENLFFESNFWYCEYDYVGIARK